MGRCRGRDQSRPKKRRASPEDNIDPEPEPKSSKQQERVRGTAARSTIMNYKLFVGKVELLLNYFIFSCK